MIRPTVGRIVWYWPSAHDHINHNDQPLAATVAYVWNDHMVNLQVIDCNGAAYARTSITLVQEGDVKPGSSYCEWMPYQKGQAAKTEALEATEAQRQGAV